MGTYTIMSTDLTLRPNLSVKTKMLLSHLANDARLPPDYVFPNNEFFKCERWEQSMQDRWILSHSDVLVSKILDDKESSFNSITHDLVIRASGKAHVSVYLKMWDWLQTMVQNRLGDKVGWFMTEDHETPTPLITGKLYSAPLYVLAVNKSYNSR